jgi:hypothetical protein
MNTGISTWNRIRGYVCSPPSGYFPIFGASIPANVAQVECQKYVTYGIRLFVVDNLRVLPRRDEIKSVLLADKLYEATVALGKE